MANGGSGRNEGAVRTQLLQRRVEWMSSGFTDEDVPEPMVGFCGLCLFSPNFECFFGVMFGRCRVEVRGEGGMLCGGACGPGKLLRRVREARRYHIMPQGVCKVSQRADCRCACTGR